MISAICTNTECNRETFLKDGKPSAKCHFCGSALQAIFISSKAETAKAVKLARIHAALDEANRQRNALITAAGHAPSIKQLIQLEHLSYMVKFFMSALLVEQDLEELLNIYAPEKQPTA